MMVPNSFKSSAGSVKGCSRKHFILLGLFQLTVSASAYYDLTEGSTLGCSTDEEGKSIKPNGKREKCGADLAGFFKCDKDTGKWVKHPKKTTPCSGHQHCIDDDYKAKCVDFEWGPRQGMDTVGWSCPGQDGPKPEQEYLDVGTNYYCDPSGGARWRCRPGDTTWNTPQTCNDGCSTDIEMKYRGAGSNEEPMAVPYLECNTGYGNIRAYGA